MDHKEEIDQLKSRFFANISHEFRTPLTLILGQVDQLRNAIAEEELHPKLQTIERNASRLLDLINQVLELAQIEAGRLDLKIENRDLVQFLSQMVQAFDPLAAQKNLRLDFQHEEQELIVPFDAYKLERVIFNLISNAIKFTPESGEVSVKMDVMEDQQRVRIQITDTGIGIRPEKVPYIFDRFFQIKVEKMQTYTGTGIGLSLVKELIDMHQGEVSVSSEVGRGSTFTVILPFGHVEGDTREGADFRLKPVEEASIKEVELPEYDGKQDSVLIVEDNAELRQYLMEELSAEGYYISVAEDGEEGLIYAKNILPDLILSDVMMPFMDGYEFSKAIRKEAKTSHIPIILLTAKASESSKIHGLSLGVDDYLFKPFSSAELKIRVKNLIEQRKLLREKFKTATVIRPSEVSVNSVDQEFLGKVLGCIEDHMSDPLFGVDSLAEEVGMSVSHLNRKLNALIDQPGGQLIRSLRMQRAQELLEKNAGNISEIAYEIGYSNPTHFTRSFKKQFGYSPSEFKKRLS